MLILLNKLKKLRCERFICGNGAEFAGRRGERIFKHSAPLIAADFISIEVDTGQILGRGYKPVGKISDVGLQGLLQRIDNLTKVKAYFILDRLCKEWITNTIFPVE